MKCYTSSGCHSDSAALGDVGTSEWQRRGSVGSDTVMTPVPFHCRAVIGDTTIPDVLGNEKLV